MTTILIICCLAIAVAKIYKLFHNAPEGYEDKSGYHDGKEDTKIYEEEIKKRG